MQKVTKEEAIQAALERVKAVVDRDRSIIIRFRDILRKDRILLAEVGWLREIIRGWCYFVNPDLPHDDSNPWYENFWEFMARYLHKRFETNYCISTPDSLRFHLYDLPPIPRKVNIIAGQGGNKLQKLPFGTSVLYYATPQCVPDDRITIQGIQVMTLPFALCRTRRTFFTEHEDEARKALSLINSSSELTDVIVRCRMHTAAARMVGAFRHVGRDDIADEIQAEMIAVNIPLEPDNPFIPGEPVPDSEFVNWTTEQKAEI